MKVGRHGTDRAVGGANQYLVNLLAQGTGRICTFGANFAILVLIARVGGADFFGQYSYVITYLGIFALVADFGMTSVLGRDIAQPHDSVEVYWGNFLILRGAIGLFAILLCTVTAYYIRRDLFPVLLMGALFLPFLAARFFEPVFQVYKRPWFSTYSSVSYGLCSLLFLIAAFWLKVNVLLAVAAFICANLVHAVFAYYLAHKSLKPIFVLRRTIITQILTLAIPLGVSALFTVIAGRVPVLMLAAVESDYAVGIYNAAYRFFELAAMAGVLLVSPFVPIFSAKANGNRDSLRVISAVIIELVGILALPVAIFTPLVSPLVISVLFGAAFLPSAEVLNILAWAGVLVFFSLFASAIVLSMGIVHFAYWNTATALVLSVALNHVWIPRLSFVGSAWATLACEALLSGIAVFIAVRFLGNIFRGRRWIRIVGLNLLFCGLLYNGFFEPNVFLRIGGSLVVYGLLTVFLKVLPEESLWLLQGLSKLRIRHAD